MSRTIPLLALVFPFALACGDSTPAPRSTANAAGDPPTITHDKLATITTADPAKLTAIANATALAPDATRGVPKDLEAGLSAVAAKSAPDMQPDGAAANGVLREGDHLAWSISLPPGKCYAIVGYSPTGEIHDLDLHLMSPPLYQMITGEDVTDDNTPAVGAAPQPMCPTSDPGMPYKVDLTAEKGAGRVAVRLYSKAAQ